jgi:murein DD-endopeptidase MepM/ murein hydrolase activator NlpD
MGRILGIDYGQKRVGIAVSDPLQIFAVPLQTVATDKVVDFIKQYNKEQPVKGLVTSGFNPAENHFAVDIAAPENSVIYAVLDGTVNFASWTDEFGYILQIQHENNLLSIYKHCSKLFRKVGDSVTAGSVVAVIGSHGLYSTGFHLHFELWHKGVPLNPEDYINF